MVVATAHLDAHGPDPAVPARAGGDPRLGRAAGGGGLAACLAVARPAPAADPDLREARAVLGLRLGLVLRDLHPADDLAGGLLRSPDAGLLARRTRTAAGCPRHLSRLPQHRTFETDEEPEVALERARSLLRERHFRVSAVPTDSSVGAERGYLREAGNLLFHLSVLVVLVGFAVGGLWGFKGGVIVVTEDSFANTLSQYDDFRAGALFDPAELDPFEFTVDDFDVTFIREGREAGMAHKFAADLTYRTSPAAAERERADLGQPPADHRRHRRVPDQPRLRAAHHRPQRRRHRRVLRAGGVPARGQHLPLLRGGEGAGRQPEGRLDPARARGRVLPDVRLHQGKTADRSRPSPTRRNPALSMLAYRGDLGLDSGEPQSVYALQKKGLDPIKQADGKPLRLDLGARQQRPAARRPRARSPSTGSAAT